MSKQLSTYVRIFQRYSRNPILSVVILFDILGTSFLFLRIHRSLMDAAVADSDVRVHNIEGQIENIL
jgi:hypothetical protein